MQLSAALLLLAAGSGTASLSGPWVANGARLELKQEGGTVIGTLATPGGPCAVKVGTELLRGSLLDDSLAAQVRLCLLQESCGSAPTPTALAMLLVTTQLTGGVHSDAACAADVRALTLRKPGAAKALAAPLANERLSHTPVPPRKLKTDSQATASAADLHAEQTRIASRVRLEVSAAQPAQTATTPVVADAAPASPPAPVAANTPVANAGAPKIASAGGASVGRSTPPPPPAAAAAPAPIVAANDSSASAKGAAAAGAPGIAPNGIVHPEAYDPLANSDDEATLLANESVDSLLKHGLAELQTGRFERARTRFRLAVTKDPNRAEAYNGVGVTYYARGDLDEALAWYKRSLEADPRFGDAWYNIGCIYALEGHKALALRYLRLAALDGYSAKEQLQQDPDLISLRNDPELNEIIDSMAAPKPSSGGGTP